MDNFRDSYFKLEWDLSQKRLKGTFWGKQYDTGRGFAVTVINGGQVVTPTTEVLRLKWEKPDGTAGYVNATIVNGKFIVENIDQMFTVAGSVRADLELSVAGEFVASITFYVSVEKAVAVDAIESSSDFSAFQQSVADFSTAVAGVTSDTEVILARGTEATLGARLDSTDAQLAETDQRIDNIITTPVPTGEIIAEEIIDARQGALSVGANITEVKSQLAEKTKQIRVTQNNPTNYEGAIVTFIDDDADPTFNDIWKPILLEKGINIGLAVVTGRVGTGNSLTLQELKDLQSEGNDIYSHTKTHYDTATTDLGVLDTEYRDSQEWLRNNGFKSSNILVYPGGVQSDRVDVKNLARKYYDYAVTTLSTYNSQPLDNWAVQRINGDTKTETEIKSYIDGTIVNNGWLVIMNHAYELNKDKLNQMNKIRAVIDYCFANNVPIMPYSEAVKYKGNAIALGEFTNSNSKFISVNGIGKDGTIIRNDSSDEMDSLIGEYKINHITIKKIISTNDTFLGIGGTMEVFRSSDESYSYATFKPFGKNKLYSRLWLVNTQSWGAWAIIGGVETGTWTPSLDASVTSGTHTYTTRTGIYSKFGNIVIAQFNINIPYINLDPTFNGYIKIGGLPFTALATDMSKGMIEHGNHSLGTNYTNVFVSANGNKLDVMKQGNGVGASYLHSNTIPIDQTVILKGQIIYNITE